LEKVSPLLLIFKEAWICFAEWIELHSDFVIATATTAIAIFTLTLFLATRKLWRTSQEQSKDLKTSLTIAQKAADATKASVDAFQAIERAKLFVKVERNPPPKPGQPIEGIKEGYNQVRVTIINEGKSVAILTKINWHIGIMDDREIDNKISEFDSSISEFPYGVITIRRDSTKNIPVNCMITNSDLQKINDFTHYVCFGKIRYKDVFRKVRTIFFCWKDNGIYFSPDPDPKRNYGT